MAMRISFGPAPVSDSSRDIPILTPPTFDALVGVLSRASGSNPSNTTAFDR